MSDKKFDERLLYLNFILKNSIAFRDFFGKELYGKDYKVRYYQYAPAFAKDKVYRAGRTLGKSVDLVMTLIQNVVLTPSVETIVTCFRKTHMRDRMEQVIKFFKTSKLLGSIMEDRGVSRQPIYEIRFKNKHIVYGISVGDDPQAAQIQGKHARYRFIEEMQQYTMPAYIQFQEARDERESHDCFYGVPDGRIGTPFSLKNFLGNQRFKDSIFNKTPRYMNPFWNQDMKHERILAFGGQDSEAYKEQILGEDGAPSSSAWDITIIMSCQEMKSNILSISNFMLDQYKLEDLMLGELQPPPMIEEIFMGADIGFDQPTQIVGFLKTQEGKYEQLFRIELKNRIPYPIQAIIIDALLKYYYNSFIGIDTTSDGGRAVADILRMKEDFKMRVHDVQFNSNVLKGYAKDGKEIKESIKAFTSVKLANMFSAKILKIMSNDEDMLEEFQLEARRRTLQGETVYFTKGTDHIIAAFRCFAYLIYIIVEGGLEFDMRDKQNFELMMPEWQEQGIPIFGSEYVNA